MKTRWSPAVLLLCLLAVLQSAAGQVRTAPAEQATGDIAAELARQERAARNEVTLAVARLELVLARQALHKQDFALAARQARRAVELLDGLPTDVDATAEKLQAKQILSRLGQGGAADRRADGTATDALGAEPAAEHREQAPASPQGRLEAARQDSHVQALLEAQQAGLIPPQEVNYPDNWLQIVARRRAYAGGLIARSESWWDEAGREWYVGVYDIEDLLLEPAYFPAPIAHPTWAAIALADRQALREQSEIFRGSPEDLAAGLPLLRFFGGFYDVDLRPRRSLAEQRRIITLIRALTQRPSGGPQVKTLDQWDQ